MQTIPFLFLLPELRLSARVARQVARVWFYSCGTALKLDFAEAKVGNGRRSKPKIVSRMSHREGKAAGRERREQSWRKEKFKLPGARRASAWLRAGAQSLGRTRAAPGDRALRQNPPPEQGDEERLSKPVSTARKKEEEKTDEMNTPSFTCCYRFFFFSTVFPL